MTDKFGVVYGVIMGVGSVLIFALSFTLTKPVKKLSEAAKEIADGNYGKRVVSYGADEVGQLSRDFNRMAAAVEKMQGNYQTVRGRKKTLSRISRMS